MTGGTQPEAPHAQRPTASSYRVHGLDLRSEIPLPEEPIEDGSSPDLEVRRGVDAAVAGFSDEDVVLRFEVSGQVRYEATALPGGWRIQAPGFAAFDLEDDQVTGWRAPDVDEGAIPLTLAGTVLAFVLTLRGSLCLHASAVEVDGRCVAFTGPSGVGKSTVAALASSAGHAFFADDLLRVGFDEQPFAYRGATEARLRPGAEGLVERVPGSARTTIDGRTAIAPNRSEASRLPIAALVLPRPDRTRTEVSTRRLSGSAAFTALLDCPRLLGWRTPAMVSQQFDHLIQAASQVPVVEVWVPWRGDFDDAVGQSIIERVLDVV